jgi:hypothetical protein
MIAYSLTRIFGVLLMRLRVVEVDAQRLFGATAVTTGALRNIQPKITGMRQGIFTVVPFAAVPINKIVSCSCSTR